MDYFDCFFRGVAMTKKAENTKTASKRRRYPYELVRERHVSDDGEEYESWGVRVREGGCEIACAYDVSTRRERVNELVKACNEGELDFIHFYDVIEDFIS